MSKARTSQDLLILMQVQVYQGKTKLLKIDKPQLSKTKVWIGKLQTHSSQKPT